MCSASLHFGLNRTIDGRHSASLSWRNFEAFSWNGRTSLRPQLPPHTERLIHVNAASGLRGKPNPALITTSRRQGKNLPCAITVIAWSVGVLDQNNCSDG